MDTSVASGVAAAFSGWLLREWTSPGVVVTPCSCECRCEPCEPQTGSWAPWLLVIFTLVIGALGTVIGIYLFRLNTPTLTVSPVKGSKGVFGSTGKALPISH